MTWGADHRRGDVLRAVVQEADRRLDGRLPTDVPGVTETFADDHALLGALQLRWHTRLSGAIERQLNEEPMAPEASVRIAWVQAAEAMPGVRAILDHAAADPADDAMTAMMTKATAKEWAMLAASAGLASLADQQAQTLGRRVEDAARAQYVPALPAPAEQHEASLLHRLKAVLAA